jgi:hypothetical protein
MNRITMYCGYILTLGLLCLFQVSKAQIVTTLDAKNVTPYLAELQGTVDPQGQIGTPYFEWNGGSPITGTPGTISGTGEKKVYGFAVNLTPNTTYSYRIYFLDLTPKTTRGDFKFFTTGTNGIEDNNLQQHMILFPNPANGIVNVKLADGIVGQTLEITNLLGKVVLIKKIDVSFDGQVDITNLTSGIYIVKVSTEKENITKQLIVQ